MEISLANIQRMKECEMKIDENRYLQIEDFGKWLVGYRGDIYRIFISNNGNNFLKFTINNLNNKYTLTSVYFHGENIEVNHPKFYPIMKMYGPEILKALDN